MFRWARPKSIVRQNVIRETFDDLRPSSRLFFSALRPSIPTRTTRRLNYEAAAAAVRPQLPYTCPLAGNPTAVSIHTAVYVSTVFGHAKFSDRRRFSIKTHARFVGVPVRPRPPAREYLCRIP